MSLFGKIAEAIFSHPAAAPAPARPVEPQATGMTPEPQPTGITPEPPDVEAVLDDMAKDTDEALDWRSSIVDLLKLLNLDSSLEARRALARELHYAGASESDTKTINIWLHQQVIDKLKKSGGKITDHLTG